MAQKEKQYINTRTKTIKKTQIHKIENKKYKNRKRDKKNITKPQSSN